MATARHAPGVRLTPAIMTALASEHDPSLRQRLGQSEPLLWLNPTLAPAAEALAGQALTWDEIRSASAAFERWRPVLRRLFPELTEAGIESALEPLPDASAVLRHAPRGGVWLKRDDALPVVGSIKARGGCFEVLRFAEDLAPGGRVGGRSVADAACLSPAPGRRPSSRSEL
jgi:D-serine dehydratase